MPIVDIRAIGFEPKPSRAAYDRALELTRWQPADTVFFEDTLVNLCTAKACGMQTVYIAPASNRETVPEYVDAVYPDVVSAILAMTR
jgi:FMN phosphatase YigB (HAD superfamily)